MTIEVDAGESVRCRRRNGAAYASQIIRFEELTPNWRAFPESHLPDNHRGFYQYIGPGASDNPMSAVKEGDNFSFGIVVTGPGRGGPLHAHTTEEVFVALSRHVADLLGRARGSAPHHAEALRRDHGPSAGHARLPQRRTRRRFPDGSARWRHSPASHLPPQRPGADVGAAPHAVTPASIRYLSAASATFGYREAGASPLALLLHGFGMDSRMWDDVMSRIGTGRRCVAVDLRGAARHLWESTEQPPWSIMPTMSPP